MKATIKNALEFLKTEKNIVIPIYQRNYSWREMDCEKLFEDIILNMNSKVSHFTGTICYKESDDGIFVVDGQQRLTSLMLLLMAIRDITVSDYFKATIEQEYLFDLKDESKLILKTEDMKDYHNLLKNETNLFMQSKISDEAQSNICKNYTKFHNLICAFLSESPEIHLIEILDAIKKLEFVALNLEDVNPQEAFESLNTTGVSLTEVDKIRNYIMMPIADNGEIEKCHHKYWKPMEKLVGEDNLEEFIISCMVILNKSEDINGIKIAPKTLYQAFKEMSKRRKAIQLLKDISEFLEYYKKLKNGNDVLNVIFRVLNAQSAMTFCLYLLKKEADFCEDLTEAYELYLSYIIRGLVCERVNLKNSHVGYLISCIDGETNREDFLFELKRAFVTSDGTFKFPTDKEFREALINNDIYLSMGPLGTKYLLYNLEKPETNMENGTIEHIMPQTLTKEWEKALEKDRFCHSQNLHTLGNLAITNFNSTLSNKAFEDKCKIYKNEIYLHTKDIAKYKKWTSKEIKERAENLSYIATNVWKDIKVEDVIKKKETYTIFSLCDNLAGKKPSVVSLFGEQVKVKSWNEMLYYIVLTLYELDAIPLLSFIDANSNQNSAFLSRQIPPNAYKKIGEGIYLKINGSAIKTFLNIKKLIEFYDVESEHCVSNDFWFSTI